MKILLKIFLCFAQLQSQFNRVLYVSTTALNQFHIRVPYYRVMFSYKTFKNNKNFIFIILMLMHAYVQCKHKNMLQLRQQQQKNKKKEEKKKK